MGSPQEDEEAAWSRRDALVQQLLDERRRRLQSKLCQDSGTWLLSGDAPRIGNAEQPTAAPSPSSYADRGLNITPRPTPRLITMDSPDVYAGHWEQSHRETMMDEDYSSAWSRPGPSPRSASAASLAMNLPSSSSLQMPSTPVSAAPVGHSRYSEPLVGSAYLGDDLRSSDHIPADARVRGRSADTKAVTPRGAERTTPKAKAASRAWEGRPSSASQRPSPAGAKAGLGASGRWQGSQQAKAGGPGRHSVGSPQGQAVQSPGVARQRPRSAPPVRPVQRPRLESANQPGAGKAPQHHPEESSRNFQTRLQDWTNRHQALQHRQQLARSEKENREMQQCTFRPAINAKSEFYARKARGCYQETLAERLHHEADKRETLRTKAKELLETDTMCSYTFQPQINRTRPSQSTGSRAPIHMRTEEIQQKKDQKLRAVQAAKDEGTECHFQPKISGRSEKLVQRKRDKLYRALSQGDGQCLQELGPVEERLYAQGQASQERRIAQRDGGDEISHTTPSVDEQSRRICKSSVYFQGPQQDFLTRQQTFELAKQRRMEMRSHHADGECSFRPTISETSRHIVSNNIEIVGESADDRVTRLAVRDVERREQLRGALEQLHYREYTFKPEVNSVSKKLATQLEVGTSIDSFTDSAGVHERLYRTSVGGKSRFSDDSRLEECSFKPQVDPQNAKRFAHVKAHYPSRGSGVMDDIHDELERKQELLSERRREAEELQMADCTFTPETRKPHEASGRAVVVNGLDRFFELKGLADKQKQEQEDRERRTFRPELLNTHSHRVTIPEPFNLSSGPGNDTSLIRKKQEFMYGSDECTFVPQTNESANREIIRQIMSTPAEVY